MQPSTGPEVGPQIIFGMDADGRCTLSVGRGLAELGYKPGELVGQDLFTVFRRDPGAVRSLHRVLAGESFSVEREYDGRILSVYYEPLCNADGVVTGAVGVTTDVTHQRRMEHDMVAAREELMKFKALADASDDLIAITDTKGRLAYQNPRSKNFGADVDESDVWATLATHAGGRQADAVREALESDHRWSGDLNGRIGDREVMARLSAFELRHPGTGTEMGHAWITQDVTDLRATEAALRTANADLGQFKALVEASPDFIAIAALDGSVQYVNPAGRELIGLPSDVDVRATTIADYLTHEGLEASITVEQPAVIEHGHWEGESTLRHHGGGAPIPVAIASFLIRDPETGAPFALATVQRDLTERVSSERALRDLADQRQALLTRLVDAQDAERTRIAADVHDDPVQACAAVDLRLGLLHRQVSRDAPGLVEAVESVQATVSNATERLRALLFDLEPPDLERGLGHALEHAAEEIFHDSSVAWSVDAHREPAVPDTTKAIAYRIAKEAMLNARKHAKADRVHLTVAAADEALVVVVKDDGTGLADATSLATPGHRGLVTMRDRATVAGGRCTVSAPPEGGTLVEVWLP